MTPELTTTAAPGSLVAGPSTAALAALRALADEATRHDAHARSANTQRAYSSDWAQFRAWCERLELSPLPVDPAMVRLYVTDMASQRKPSGAPRYRASTIERHAAAIGWYSRMSGGSGEIARHPAVASVIAGVRRTRAEKPERQRPVLLDSLRRVIMTMPHDTWPHGLLAARDTLAFGLGFAAALRRSEVAGLLVSDLEPHAIDGLHVHLGVTKTDQDGAGAVLAIPYGENPTTCVPCARVRWIRLLEAPSRAAQRRLVEATGPANEFHHVCRDLDSATLGKHLADMPLLRTINKGGRFGTSHVSGGALNSALKRRLEEAGLQAISYGFHSLRAGFVTEARRNGADTRSVRRQTRHASDAMVDVYDREYMPLRDNAVTTLGL